MVNIFGDLFSASGDQVPRRKQTTKRVPAMQQALRLKLPPMMYAGVSSEFIVITKAIEAVEARKTQNKKIKVKTAALCLHLIPDFCKVRVAEWLRRVT